jgi:hypothetical protein
MHFNVQLMNDDKQVVMQFAVPLEDGHHVDWYAMPASVAIVDKGRYAEHFRITANVDWFVIPVAAVEEDA